MLPIVFGEDNIDNKNIFQGLANGMLLFDFGSIAVQGTQFIDFNEDAMAGYGLPSYGIWAFGNNAKFLTVKGLRSDYRPTSTNRKHTTRTHF